MQDNIDALKEEELMNTIRMEPILEKTMILDEPLVKMKEKRIKVTDYILIALILIVIAIFVIVLLKVK